MSYNRKKSSAGLIFGLIVLVLISVGGYLYLSPVFEQNKPIIEVTNSSYWNLKSKFNINIKDESGIKYYKITFKDGKRNIVLHQEVFNTVKNEVSIDLDSPKLDMFTKSDYVVLEIETVDNSKWNFLDGNIAIKTVDLKIDTKRPTASVLSNSRYIQRGGSAVVVVKVEDENLQDKYITFNNERKFKLLPYKKEGYYVALIAWPIDIEKFNRINLVAIDKANNKTVTKVPFYIQKKKIRIDDIKLSEKFIQNVSAFVLEQSSEKVPSSLEDIFIYSNTELRAKNIDQLKLSSNEAMTDETIEDFDIRAFKRLRGSKTVAGYAERRHYYLNGTKINEAWHLGIDWASVRNATIKTSNKGTVIYNGYLGLYGNSIIIDHGMGLSSLYAHTSTQNVEVGDAVKRNQKIAKTGATGAVFGDHLHFGILVQGEEVNPLEWMDKNWIKVRITNVLNNANKQIVN